MVDLNDGGQHIVSFHAFDFLTSVKYLASLLLDLFKSLKVLVDTSRHVKWSKQGVLVERVAHSLLEGWVGLDHPSHEGVVDVLMQEESPEAGASLATSSHGSKYRALESQLHVTVRHHNGGIVSSQFKDSLTESPVNLSTHMSADVGGASERDEWHSLVHNQSISNVWSIATANRHHVVEAMLC